MLKLGITGGIGCGKSVVSHLLRLQKIPVFSADKLAKILMNHNQKIRARLIDIFGREIFTSNGRLDRRKMAEIIFSHPELREKVNEIVHPEVIAYEHKLIDRIAQNQKRKIAGVEAALMFEAGSDKYYDLILVVAASPEMIFQRLKIRDGISEEEIKKRIDSQMPLEEKIKRADFVIFNDGSLTDLKFEVEKFVEKLKLIAKLH